MEDTKFAGNEQRAETAKLQLISEEIHWSETRGELAKALAKAQLNFKPILKESENPAFARGGRVSKYADLHNLISATQPALAAEGLVVIQVPTVSVGGKLLVMTTTLLHGSGEWLTAVLKMPAADERGFTAHSIGKAITYARRYSYAPLIGATAEDDDDGNEASGVGSKDAQQKVAQRKIAETKERMATGEHAPELTYLFNVAETEVEVSGDMELLKANQELLRHYGGKRKGTEYKMIVPAQNFDDLRYALEDRGVPFHKFRATNGEEIIPTLQKSIEQVKGHKDA